MSRCLAILFVCVMASSAEAAKTLEVHMKSTGAAMHGKKMSVEYIVLNNGKHMLIAKEIVGYQGKKPQFTDRQTIEVPLQKDEVLSPFSAFKCRNEKKQIVYAAILAPPEAASKKSAAKTTITPRLAWNVDEAAIKLEPVTDLKAITCDFHLDGD